MACLSRQPQHRDSERPGLPHFVQSPVGGELGSGVQEAVSQTVRPSTNSPLPGIGPQVGDRNMSPPILRLLRPYKGTRAGLRGERVHRDADEHPDFDAQGSRDYQTPVEAVPWLTIAD